MRDSEQIFRIHRRLKGSHGAVSKQCLAAELEVSGRTIARNIEFMRDRFDAPIIYDRRQGGYRYEASQGKFELPGFWFQSDELYALLAASRLFDALQPGILTESLRPLRQRIDALLDQSGHSHARIEERIILKNIAQRSTKHQQFTRIASAVMQGTPLQIAYHARSNDQHSQRLIHPYRLLYYRNNWYLIAWCEQRQDLRNFALERIRHAQALKVPLRNTASEAIERCINNTFGIFLGTPTAWALLAFTERSARWVSEEIWHPEQTGYWQDGRYHLKIPYAQPTELVMDILRYGKDVEVLAPAELRAAVMQALRDAVRQYEENTSKKLP